MSGRFFDTLKPLIMRLPGLALITEKQRALDRRAAALAEMEAHLMRKALRLGALGPRCIGRTASLDPTPWNHPFLQERNLRRFQEFSNSVWTFAQAYHQSHPSPLRCAFAVNMAQNMHNWARLAQRYGAEVTLFPNEMDRSALNRPEWEEFDGEFDDPMDGERFLNEHPDIKLDVRCSRIPFDGSDFYTAYQQFCEGDNRAPFLQLVSSRPHVRYETLLAYEGFYPYVGLARALSEHEVIFMASTPFAAYASGRPYCTVSVGGDLIFDCGRADDLGVALHLAFAGARFLMVCNPHTLGHARRLGLSNGVYLPYPVDTNRYSPGSGQTRKEWEARYGKRVFVLTTARVDSDWKGYDDALFKALVDVTKKEENLHFIFLAWGSQVEKLRACIDASGLRHRMTLLPPVGKKRLIDYYRSCDIVLDQFVSGYFAATSLEAAAIGKPVIMKLRTGHYAPQYQGSVPPVLNAGSPVEVVQHLIALAGHPQGRIQLGAEMRNWLVRFHGHERTVPLMLALLRLAADQVPLPADFVNPLTDPETEEERQYHAACRTGAS
jgi:glycosyltransferase involved in cell wall biosynthesis